MGVFSSFWLSFAVLSASAAVTGELLNPEDETDVWGKKITGLGTDGNDVALVFTKTNATMSMSLPKNVRNVTYLVVGGGGGGASTGNAISAGGGGAGGVVSGTVTAGKLTVNVGVGGAGASSGKKDNQPGGQSTLKVGSAEVIVAYGGGKGGSGGPGQGGAGFGSGGGGSCVSSQGKYVGQPGGDAGQGCKGGDGFSGTYRGGGGGGAGEPGQKPTSTDSGKGGDGIESDITGESVWYAGGGGGGSHTNGGIPSPGGAGGGGAGGKAASNANGAGGNATYYGGGGGGAMKAAAGGSGYQGVVIVRYTVDPYALEVPRIEGKVYTGELLTADVPTHVGYSVTQNAGGIEAGEYVVELTPKTKYYWDETGLSSPLRLVFRITPAQNEWVEGTPAVSKPVWIVGDPEVRLTPGATQFGTPTATLVMNGAITNRFVSLPVESGRYELIYTVQSSGNWIDPAVTSKSVTFQIVGLDDVPPFAVKMGETETVEDDPVASLSVGYRVESEFKSDKTVSVFAVYAEEGAVETNTVVLAEGVRFGTSAAGMITNVTPGATYWVSLYGEGGTTIAPATEFRRVTVAGPATNLTASAMFTNDPMEFVISGYVTRGIGQHLVEVHYSLNRGDEIVEYPELADDGTFSQAIPYENPWDELTWYVVVENRFGLETWITKTPPMTRVRVDTSPVTYIWSGDAHDGNWMNPANWLHRPDGDCFGYPDNKTYATAQFPKSTAVNLGGASLDLVQSTGLTVDPGFYIVLSNGTLNADYATDHDFCASNTTVVLRDITLVRERLAPNSCSTVVFEGNSTLKGMLRPFNVNGVTVVFRDGEHRITGIIHGYGDNLIRIENAKLTVDGSPTATWPFGSIPMRFTDGPGRHAQLVATDAKAGWNFNQPLTFVPDGHAYDAPFIQAVMHYADKTDQSLKITVDMTKWRRSRRLPLVRFTSSSEQKSFAELVEKATLYVYDYSRPPGRQNVKAERNARLVWDGGANTLYFQQAADKGTTVVIR